MNLRDVAMGLLLLGTVVCLGCGEADPYNRQSVSGEVLLDGAPAPKGSIKFLPASGEPTMVGTAITDGKYQITRDGGPAPGDYFVQINIPDPSGRAVTLPGRQPMVPDIVPPEFNQKNRQRVTISKDKPNEFKFEIKTK